MAYQYSNAAREIASIKRISTRNLLMVLASAVDSKTGTCFHSVECLRHWSQLAKGTFYQAVDELETAGILSRERRRRGNRTNLWRLDIKTMESMRVSWDSIRPKDSVPEDQEEPIRPPKQDKFAAADEFIKEQEAKPFQIDNEGEEFACVSCHQEPVMYEGGRCQTCINKSIAQQEAESAAALARKKAAEQPKLTAAQLGHTPWETDAEYCSSCKMPLDLLAEKQKTCADATEERRQRIEKTNQERRARAGG